MVALYFHGLSASNVGSAGLEREKGLQPATPSAPLPSCAAGVPSCGGAGPPAAGRPVPGTYCVQAVWRRSCDRERNAFNYQPETKLKEAIAGRHCLGHTS